MPKSENNRLIDSFFVPPPLIYYQENFELIIKILNNGYPLKLIFSEIKNRLSKKFKQWNDQINTPKEAIDNNEGKINHRFFYNRLFPFLSEKIKIFFFKVRNTHDIQGD